MLASIGTLLLEDIYGKKLSSILADLSGVDIKTWKSGGPKSPEKIEYAKKQIERTVLEKLKIAGWNKENIHDRIYGASTRCNGTSGIFSTLIDIVSGHGLYHYERSMRLANALDITCVEWNTIPPEHTKARRDKLLSHPLYRGDTVAYLKKDKTLREIRKALQEGTNDIEIIHQAAGVTTWFDLVSLLACLDVEFCDSQFFFDDVYRMERIPLFSLVLPEADLDQIQLGKKPPRKWVNPPFKRLIEFHAFILESKRQGRWPTTMPTPQQQDRYFSPHDPKDGESMHLPNLRSGRNKLPISKYLAMWNHGYQLLEGSDGEILLPPIPMYLAATVWDRLFVERSRSINKVYISSYTTFGSDFYLSFWKDYNVTIPKPRDGIPAISWPNYIIQS